MSQDFAVAALVVIAAFAVLWVAYWSIITCPVDEEMDAAEKMAKAEQEDFDNLLN